MSDLAHLLTDQHLTILTPEASVYEAALKMTSGKTGSVLVMEHGKLKGIFTERDLMNRVVAMGRDYKKTALKEVMTLNIRSVTTSETVENCYKIMRANRCRHLPIIDESENILGVVSIRDVLDVMVHDAEQENKVLKQYISS